MTNYLKFAFALAISLTGIQISHAGNTGNDTLLGNRGNDYLAVFDEDSGVLLVVGDARDNVIMVAASDNGDILINNGEVAVVGGTPTLRNTAIVVLDGAEGQDTLIADHIPLAAMRGGADPDLLIWNYNDGEFQRAVVGNDTILWSLTDGSSSLKGGAGLDILIGNTGGDRLFIEGFGDLGNDWIVGGTQTQEASYGGWGNDLLNADDVMTME